MFSLYCSYSPLSQLTASPLTAAKFQFVLTGGSYTDTGYAFCVGWGANSNSGNPDGFALPDVSAQRALTTLDPGDHNIFTYGSYFETNAGGTLDFEFTQQIATVADLDLLAGTWFEVIKL